ncbi:MAG: hypothetical protein HY675_20170 [Chloroflexi bacterium]|nr:hypothetical protein [Chloroflexota bacterium]
MARRTNIGLSEPSRPVLGLFAIAVVGFVVGFLFGGAWSRVGQQGIKEDDYFVMVSALFERERSLANAQDRLAVLGRSDIARATLSLSETYPRSHPEAQVEARSLRQLANALNGVAATGTDGRATSGSPTDSGSNGIWFWLGVALVLICLLGFGGPLILRFAAASRGRLTARGLGGTGSSRVSRVRRETARPIPFTRRTPGRVLSSEVRSDGANQQPSDGIDSTVGLKRGIALGLQFESRYQFGEEPYDEVHPIVDGYTGDLIGACGTSAVLKLNDTPHPRYFAFSVWAHDYVSDEPLKNVVIVSRWAQANAPPELVSWAGNGVIDQVLPVGQGLQFTLETYALRVEVMVDSFRFGTDAESPRDSYFTNLVISFHVSIKRNRQPPPLSDQEPSFSSGSSDRMG